MATITQTIGSYSGGISQQPDELKLPGQVKDALNVLPDITHGLLKRPGGRLIKSLSDGTRNSYTTGKWFHYYRDEDEQYIGQIIRRNGHADDGKIRMWKCSDGTECAVNYDLVVTEATLTSYLQHTEDADIQTLTLNDYTFLTNRLKRVEMDTTVTAAAKPYEAYVELKKVAYASQYSLNLYDNTTTESAYTATRIKVEREIDSSNACASGGALPSSGNLPDDGNRCTSGTSNDALCPNVATEIFAVNHNADGNDADANGTDWDFTVVNTGGSASDRKNLYFRVTTTGQAVPENADSSSNYHCRYTTTYDLLYGGEGWRTGDYFYFWLKNAKYKVTIEDHSESVVQANLGLIRPMPTPFDNETTVTAESILGDVRTAILADTFGSSAGAAVEQIGNGLYIKRTSANFNINTPVKDLFNVFTDSVKDVADLPSQCKHGYVVKIANSEAAEDDYYVKFFGTNDRDGEGVWDECPEPGRMTTFKASTMPIQLVRTAANTFTVDHVDWEACPVGSEVTVPKPSFVSGYGVADTTENDPTAADYKTLDTNRLRYINKLLFFRNRMAILSDENIILSRPGDFFNFWPKTAVTYTATDNIDISCSSEYPAIIYDGIQVNTGLLLFTKNQQFMLTTDSDVLSPQTAKINSLATYNFNFNTSPISLGTTVGFLDNAGKNTRFFEMAGASREGEPDVIEQTKIVSKLFPIGIDIISNSRENSVVFFAEKDKDELFGYRYFSSIEKRLQNAWFRWKLNGTIQHLAMLDDALYAVVRNAGKDVLQKFSIKLDDSSNMLVNDLGTSSDEDDITYRIHLDNATSIPHTDLTYIPYTSPPDEDSDDNDWTYFKLPDGFNSTDGQLAVVANPTGADKTFQGMVSNVYTYTDPVSGEVRVKMYGNWKTYDPQGTDTDNSTTDDVTPAGNIILGYLYDMEVKLPTVYFQRQIGENFRSEVQGSLVVHRLKFSFGPLGVYETKLERLGKPDYTSLYESVMADAYNANQVQFTPESKATVPVYEKNTNVNITLKSTHPSPATLYSMTWEGEFNNKFYKRV